MYYLAKSFKNDTECALYDSLQSYIHIVWMFSIRTTFEAEIRQICKG